MSKREIRFAGTELRASTDAGKMMVSGTPAVYNSLSNDLGGFRESLCPGCFQSGENTEGLAAFDIYATLGHDDTKVLGRVSAGTLEVAADRAGITMRCTLPNNTIGSDVFESVRRGDLKHMSFGMYVDTDDWTEKVGADGQSYSLRTVKAARMFECSIVAYPAYFASSVAARSLFPDGTPSSVELRGKRVASSVEVDDRELAQMRARIDIAKRS
jgi:HK97 family phage prohead protease